VKIYKNKPQDLTINYGVATYKKMEDLLDIQEGETGKRINLDYKDPRNETPRTFSLRTMYQRDETDFDTYFGLITILDNLDQNFDYVVNKLAFERTEVNQKAFLKMTNVRTFYEYMLSGLEYVKREFFTYDSNVVNVADAIHDFLSTENEFILDMVTTLLEEQEAED